MTPPVVLDLPVLPAPVAGLVILTAVLALSLLETLAPLRPRVEPRPRRAARNVATYALAQGLTLPLRFVLVAPLARWVTEHDAGLLRLVEMPLLVHAVAGFLLLDATLWVWHVMNHRIGLLWRFHAAHHADLDMDATTALRFHFGELALSVGWRAAQVLVLGAGPGLLAAWEVATLVFAAWHHSNVRLPERVDRALARLVPTPRMHGIHHSTVREEHDTNYGVLTSAWDALAGTLKLDVPQERLTIGLPQWRESAQLGFWRVQALPFRRR